MSMMRPPISRPPGGKAAPTSDHPDAPGSPARRCYTLAVTIVGSIGTLLLLILCGVPLLVATLRAGHARGPINWLLFANYAGNALLIAAVLLIKVRGDRA